ncbi:hypothetical protein [Enterococcus sp.]|uniref:hypothetical protein n=1 Tax=Enterococcus sp. TaxID=35783 RepID=UPI0028A7EFC6|nr:hypothetical protein [Enterococcus sp.]
MKKITGLIVLGLVIIGTASEVNARQIGEFSSFKVNYSGSEKFTGYLTKATTGRNGVVNLSNDTGTAWITANMKNSEGAYRGGTTLQRGKRAEFKTSNAVAGYKYRMGMRKTNDTGGGSVTIKGSWSPDSY